MVTTMTTTITNIEQTEKLDEHTRTLRDRARRFEDAADPYLRGMIATRVYRDQPDLPVVLKRAEILARTLENLEPIVLPEERIVGVAYRRFQVHAGVSESESWRIRAMHPERRGFNEDWPMPEEIAEEMRWWVDHPNGWQLANVVRAQNRWLSKYAIAGPHGSVNGHTLPDHGIILEAGIAELRQRIADRLGTAVTAAQRDEYRAMDRCLEGISRHCLLCAAAARRQAQEVRDPILKERLEAAASNCAAVATQAPASFAQALQLIYLSNFADRMDDPGDAASYGRIDQLLAPFYEADIGRGTLTQEDAFDLVCHFLIKVWCVQSSTNMTIGGVKPDGSDATNDLSYVFLEAMAATEMTCDMSVRLHRDAPAHFVRTVTRVVRLSLGRPGLYNDDVTIPALIRKGIDPEDARDYAPLGCVEIMIPGRTAHRTMCMGLNLPKVLELTLNCGRCTVTGDQVWVDAPETFDTYEDLLAEVHARVRQVIELGIEIIREDERLEPSVFPRPWLTVLSRGGIESGVDMTAGQPKYDPVGVTLDGIADMANSLYAIKKLIYDQKRLTLDDLRAVLCANWEGHEALRQYVINRLPRFGQDDPEVNEMATNRQKPGRRPRVVGEATRWPCRYSPAPLAHRAARHPCCARSRRSTIRITQAASATYRNAIPPLSPERVGSTAS
jgi:formate C-acetyltransferase